MAPYYQDYQDPYQQHQTYYTHPQYGVPYQQQIPPQHQMQMNVTPHSPQSYQHPPNAQQFQPQWQQPPHQPQDFMQFQSQQQYFDPNAFQYNANAEHFNILPSHQQQYFQPQPPPQLHAPPIHSPPLQEPLQQQHLQSGPTPQVVVPPRRSPSQQQHFEQEPPPQVVVPPRQSPSQQHHFQPQQPPQVIVPPRRSPPQQYISQPAQNLHYPAVPSQQFSSTSMSPPPHANIRQPQQPRVLQDVQPNAHRQQPLYKPPPEPEPEPPEPEYPSLLLSLADEYLDAANKSKERSEDYYKLFATALACIESTLKNFKLVPLREAQLSLKYAQLLYDETTNYDDAESTLTKGIDLCERMKFLDLKYAMQLLLAKVLYQSKPKAAIRDLQGMIQDVEAYHHTAWEYSFRFQHVVFSMKMGGSNDIHAAITQVERVQHVARQNGDHAIFAFAAILEALLHLHNQSAEANSLSQNALAKARSLQLNPDIENNPQMPVMVEFINLACSVNSHEFDQIEQKRRILQDVLYKSIESGRWNQQGLIYLPLNPKSLNNVSTQEGGLIHEEKNKSYLVFSWMDKDETEAIGFLLCGASSTHKAVTDGGKAEKYMLGGLNIPKELLSRYQSASNKTTETQNRWRILVVHFLLEAGFLHCSRGQWTKAQTAIKDINTIAKELDGNLPAEIEAQIQYLTGCIQQGTGNLDSALEIFQSPILALREPSSTPASGGKPSHGHRDDIVMQISMLAAMNTALIVHSPAHSRHYMLQGLINNLDTLIHGHGNIGENKYIEGAYSFLLAVMPNSTILRTKQYLSHALEAAKKVTNNQIVGLTLTVMQEKFFKGVVPDSQAMKCAKAATHQVKTRWGDPMWIAVASNLEAECLGMLGNWQESELKRADAIRAMEMVPEKVRQGS